jgi:hypothetical protein
MKRTFRLLEQAVPQKRDVFRIVLFEPSVDGFVIWKDLEVADVADFGAGVDVDQDFHWFLASFRFPQ